MTFTIRNYPSSERYDISKFMDFFIDCYDVVNSPFLIGLKELPVVRYYDVNNGYKDIDSISQDVYNNQFYTYLIMFYNDLTSEIVSENTVLKLFSLDDLDELYFKLSNSIIS